MKLFDLVILIICIANCLSFEIDVYSSCSDSYSDPFCFELDSALESVNSSTTLYLQPGTHILRHFHLLAELDDVAIIGDEIEGARIHCENKVGLAFVKMDRLVISDVTIDGCGLTGTSLRDVTDLVKNFVNMTFFVPNSVNIAVYLAQCTDLQILNSVITGTTGLGMLAINVWNATLTYVDFTENRSPKCSQRSIVYPYHVTTFGGIGGGAYFLFEDAVDPVLATGTISLEISNCNFKWNAECSLAGYLNVNYPYLTLYPNIEYTIGGGGGLSLFTPQSMHSIRAVVKDSNFSTNHARYGAGAHIGLFIGATDSDVLFERCFFDWNGYPMHWDDGVNRPQVSGGAGVALFLDLLRESDVVNGDLTVCDYCRSVTFTDTNFFKNSALIQGGGVMAYILSIRLHVIYNVELDATISFQNCKFTENSAKYGSALHVSQRVLLGVDGHWSVNFSHVHVKDNFPAYYFAPGDDSRGFSNDQLSAVDLRGIIAAVGNGSLVIEDNLATGLHLMSTLLFLFPHTTLMLRNNKARRGGGVYMDGNTPVILADANSSVVFDSNSATSEGGAVFYQSHLNQQGILEPIPSLDCFISSTSAYSGEEGSKLFDSNITIEFRNNKAPLGSIVFGSTLSSCTWARELGYSKESLLSVLHENYNSTFKFDAYPKGRERISTDPHSIEVVNGSELSAFPGQRKKIFLDLLDVFSNEVEAVITSDTTNKSRNNVTVGPNGFWYYIDRFGATLYARGESNNVTVSLFTASNLVSTDFTITVLDCPPGFDYDSEDQVCVCDEMFENGAVVSGVTCDDRLIQLNISSEKWLGCENDDECTTENLMSIVCYFHYCDRTMMTHAFDPSDPSNQCALGSRRTGIMCGKCEEGYSIQFGLGECGECSNSDLAVVFIVLALLGLVLFVVISFLDVTVDKGWMNMVILYSNIAFPYRSLDSTPLKFLLLFVRWVSLEFGLSLCAFHEMDALGEVGFSLIFPAYMYILMIIFAILCRYFKFFREFSSPTKTLVTLTFLLYVRLFRTSVTILAPIFATYLNGTIKYPYRWLEDPNVVYFEGFHCFLGIIAIVLFLGYLIWFPLILFTPPSLAYKYGKRFKPFLDAIWAPYRPKLRFWASFRLILRILVVMIPKFGFSSIIRGISLNASLLLAFLYFQAMIRPFNESLINICDSLLIVCAIFLHSSAFVTMPDNPSVRYIVEFYFYVAFFICLSYIVIVVTLVWYSRKSTTWRKLAECFRRFVNFCRKLKWKRYKRMDTRAQEAEKRPTHTSIYIVESVESDDVSRYPYHRHKSFTHARESILEEQSLSSFTNQ